MKRIVVGVDGSDAAQAALRWAHDEAHLRRCGLHVVHAFEIPFVTAIPGAGAVMVPADLLIDQAKGLLEAAVGSVIDPTREPIPVTTQAIQGRPAHTLIDASADADLLVVGMRGHGGVAGLRIGSVASHCVHHGHCPVVVVPSGHHGH